MAENQPYRPTVLLRSGRSDRRRWVIFSRHDLAPSRPGSGHYRRPPGKRVADVSCGEADRIHQGQTEHRRPDDPRQHREPTVTVAPQQITRPTGAPKLWRRSRYRSRPGWSQGNESVWAKIIQRAGSRPRSESDAEQIQRAKAKQRFRDRDLSGITIRKLIKAGIDAPERLLFMSLAELGELRGIGPAERREIDAYRSRFVRA